MSRLEQTVALYLEELGGAGSRADAMRRAVSRTAPRLEAEVAERTDARRVELVQLSDDALRARAAGAGLSWRSVLVEALALHEARNDVQARVLERALADEPPPGLW